MRKLSRDGEPLLRTSQHIVFGFANSIQQVFEDATTYTCLLFLRKDAQQAFDYAEVDDLEAWAAAARNGSSNASGDGSADGARESRLDAGEASAGEDWNFIDGPARPVFEKLAAAERTVGDVAARIAQGIRTSANTVYVLDLTGPTAPEDALRADVITARSSTLGREVELEPGAVNLFLKGKEIKPFRVLPSGKGAKAGAWLARAGTGTSTRKTWR